MPFSVWDNQLLDLINRRWAQTELDGFAQLLSSTRTWVMVAGAILILAIVLKKKHWIKVLLVCGVALGVSDATNTYLLKNEVRRLRPCHQREVVLRAGVCGSQFGMPSNHAANGAAVWVASSFFLTGFPRVLLALFVLLVGWSRIYLGVHFPFDVMAGWAVGGLLGALTTKMLIKLATYLKSFR